MWSTLTAFRATESRLKLNFSPRCTVSSQRTPKSQSRAKKYQFTSAKWKEGGEDDDDENCVYFLKQGKELKELLDWYFSVKNWDVKIEWCWCWCGSWWWRWCCWWRRSWSWCVNKVVKILILDSYESKRAEIIAHDLCNNHKLNTFSSRAPMAQNEFRLEQSNYIDQLSLFGALIFPSIM